MYQHTTITVDLLQLLAEVITDMFFSKIILYELDYNTTDLIFQSDKNKKDLPVPAAHLSFIAKFLTVPSGATAIPFTS